MALLLCTSHADSRIATVHDDPEGDNKRVRLAKNKLGPVQVDISDNTGGFGAIGGSLELAAHGW